MRKINRIVVHCSYTKPGQDIGAKEIDGWHRSRGWDEIGYHYVIRRNGRVETGRPVGKVGAHAKGYNEDSIGVCIVGGMDNNGKPDCNYTTAQYLTLSQMLQCLCVEHEVEEIVGHRDLAGVTKECPCCDMTVFLGD